MKTVQVIFYTLVMLSLMVLVVGIASLGGRSLGMVGGWVWGMFWHLLGVVGAVLILTMGGAYAILFFWRTKRLKGA
jgi:hypothetical protein